LLYHNLHGLKVIQIYFHHESLKLDPEEKRLPRTINESDVDLKDHRQDHQLLLMLNGPIYEVMVLVQVHVNWNYLEEGE
jgi:hypothetical protein